jgi:hypothetical protein
MRRRHAAQERAKRRKLRRIDLTPTVLERLGERQALEIGTMIRRVIAKLDRVELCPIGAYRSGAEADLGNHRSSPDRLNSPAANWSSG